MIGEDEGGWCGPGEEEAGRIRINTTPAMRRLQSGCSLGTEGQGCGLDNRESGLGNRADGVRFISPALERIAAGWGQRHGMISLLSTNDAGVVAPDERARRRMGSTGGDDATRSLGRGAGHRKEDPGWGRSASCSRGERLQAAGGEDRGSAVRQRGVGTPARGPAGLHGDEGELAAGSRKRKEGRERRRPVLEGCGRVSGRGRGGDEVKGASSEAAAGKG